METFPKPYGDGRLWAIALAASLLGNVVIFTLTGMAAIDFAKRQTLPSTTEGVAEPQTTLLLSADLFATEPAAAGVNPPPAVRGSAFARTAEDQRGKRPEAQAFFGERDTEATSDRAPDPSAVPLPSQKGVEPRHVGDLETTESTYREGAIDSADAPPQPAMPPAAPAEPAAPAPEISPQTATPDMAAEPGESAPEAPQPAELLSGPNPVDVAISRPKAPPAAPAVQSAPLAAVADSPKPPAKPSDPAFRGNQHKTAIVGSISRTGRSALDVADSPLGRYQAIISRAVELEWQRNCVRHRDFITPGFLTVRFFVEPSGKVRTVQFVGDMETGEVQKGFTLNSIRDAAIPPMPAAVKKDFAKEPLELIFNFYF